MQDTGSFTSFSQSPTGHFSRSKQVNTRDFAHLEYEWEMKCALGDWGMYIVVHPSVGAPLTYFLGTVSFKVGHPWMNHTLSCSLSHCFNVLMTLERILSVDFEIPQGWINRHLAGGEGQPEAEEGRGGRTESLLGSVPSRWVLSAFFARCWSKTNKNVMT